MSEQKILRFGGWMIAGALFLRLTVSFWTPAVQAAQQVKLGQVLLFLQTGRIVRYVTAQEQTDTGVDAPRQTQALPVFTQSDQELLFLRNESGQDADIPAALLTPLQWDLYGNEPTVLIIHSHGSESYTKTEDYQESTAFRTLNTDYNMVSVGDLLAQKLEQAGIPVIHDRTMYDVPSYNDAYVAARAGIEAHMEENPSICLVLDLHRDAATDASGNQIRHVVTTEDAQAAKLMLVLGTNHSGWQTNLALASKLQVQLERLCPGICRPANLRAQRFNQDLCPNTLLVEVGTTGNTRQEALAAAEYLAEAIISLASGSG